MTGGRYRDEDFEPYVRFFKRGVGPDFIFMNDNAPSHHADLVDDFRETEDIQRMMWPANSPALDPIEYVWDMLLQPFRTNQNTFRNCKKYSMMLGNV